MRAAVIGVTSVLGILCFGCKSDSTPSPLFSNDQSRTYRMGFSGLPPREDLAAAVASIDMWSLRADDAIISNEVPWDSLLDGVSPESIAARYLVGLANYFRLKRLSLRVYVDPANGLNRAGEPDLLVTVAMRFP